MPSRRLLFAALVTCAVAFPVAGVTHACMDSPAPFSVARTNRPTPWLDPVQWGWSWLTGLAVGGWFGLCYYGWATERDPEQDNESLEDFAGGD
jgi:hypothetical protein